METNRRLAGLMVYNATRCENTCSGLTPPFAVVSPPRPYYQVSRNTACSLCCAPAHYKSGNFHRSDRDKGTRIQNMPALISHDDHDILSERLNRFTKSDLSGAYLSIGERESVHMRGS